MGFNGVYGDLMGLKMVTKWDFMGFYGIYWDILSGNLLHSH